MKKSKTKRDLQIEKIKSEFVKYCNEKEAEETRSADSFRQVQLHFNEAVASLGDHLLGCKASFSIQSVTEKDDREMVFLKVNGEVASGKRMVPANHVLESKGPSNFIAYLLWDCIGYAKGVFKLPY